MADQIMIGAGIKLDGEADFVKAVANIGKNQSVLASEMRKVTAEFADNATSEKALSALSEEYNKKIEVQKNKVNLLQAALENARKEYGDNSDKVKDWQIKLNNAETQLAQSESALKGLDTELKKSDTALEEAGDSAEKSGERFSKYGDVLKGVGVSLGAIAVAAGAAAIKLGQEVVEQFGELEQNLGGSEAVFGEYAASIQKTGEEAYKNLGASQSEYLANANKMGALLQGAGIAQQESLDLTVKAMQRAADMASVMGIDTSSALEAVTGAAKGNFTMMDNLGVAMNATTIQAYALSKGLDFTWATASNADKAQLAMQMFFEQTEQYAGNFAREATETISGSIGLLKSALASFTAGLGNAEADMTNLTQNLVDAFEAVVDNIVPVLGNIVSALPQVTNELSKAIVELLPTFLEAGSQIVTSLIQGITEQLPELADGAFQVVNEFINSLLDLAPDILLAGADIIINLANGIADSLPELIPAATKAITTFVQGLADKLPQIIQAGCDLFIGLQQGILNAIPDIIAAIPGIIKSLVEALVAYIPKMGETGVELFKGLFSNLPGITDAIDKLVPDIIQGIVEALTGIDFETDFGEVGSQWAEWIFAGFSPTYFGKKLGNAVFESLMGTTPEEYRETQQEKFDAVRLRMGLFYNDEERSAVYGQVRNARGYQNPSSTTETTSATETTSNNSTEEPVPVADENAIANAKELAESIMGEYADGASRTASAVDNATNAITTLTDTISSAASSAGITLEDSVDEAAQKIVDKIEKQTEMQALIAEAQARAEQMMSGTADTTSLASFSQALGKYINSGEGYIMQGKVITWAGGEDSGKQGIVGSDKNISWWKNSNAAQPASGTGYIQVGDKLYWTGVDNVASQQGISITGSEKAANIVNNYSISADMSKVKDLAGLQKAIEEAKQQQRAGYVE